MPMMRSIGIGMLVKGILGWILFGLGRSVIGLVFECGTGSVVCGDGVEAPSSLLRSLLILVVDRLSIFVCQ